ncbi:hypothetical protein P8C59_004003 [Phyllachora maydis]|uniref:Uncharacterized protein n=1 Tax=Phyllachora maydis TaxID=1825666 RepID=A0AAD9I1U5_9PEZI|nr:hypothetical protein P8C59_004003 [Phyllachora maydis]
MLSSAAHAPFPEREAYVLRGHGDQHLTPLTAINNRPIIEDAIVSEAIEPNKRYKLRNSLAKGITLEGLQYIEEAVSCFNLADSKPISIPL